jgi:hypothetical protein
MAWINSGLEVRFDAEFMAQVVGCIESKGSLEKLIESHAYYADRVANMDYCPATGPRPTAGPGIWTNSAIVPGVPVACG